MVEVTEVSKRWWAVSEVTLRCWLGGVDDWIQGPGGLTAIRITGFVRPR